MSKRRQDAREDSPYSKRQKISGQSKDAAVQTAPDKIESSKGLKQLLTFDQAGGPQVHQRVRSFKQFLDSVAYSDDDAVKAANRALLHDYFCHYSTEASALADLIQTWSFAAQSNDERLFSAVAAVLALFLKTTSSHIEFRKVGNHLCRVLLEDDSVRLIERGLSAAKIKQHIVSPCLGLLTEIVAYDGGAAAKLLWHRRDVVFHRLETFLTLRRQFTNDPKQSRRKPPIRDNALRYLLTNLKLQSPIAKAGILTLAQGKLVRAAFQNLEEESSTNIVELLNVFRKHVMADPDLSRNVKRGLFRDETLARVAALYRYKEDLDPSEQQSNVRKIAHEFLLFVCTSPLAELLYSSSSPHAQGIDAADSELNGFASGKPSIGAPTTCSKVLSTFLQGLRPYANLLEGELVLAVFDASPGMVKDYFQRKKSFSFEPKLSATWLGYARFITSVISLSIGTDYVQGLHSRPGQVAIPASTLIETCLPSPLSQNSLTRCLNQSVDLIRLLAVKLLIMAFQKLENLIGLLSSLNRKAGPSSTAPDKDTVAHLLDEFRRKCPDVRHVITGFRRCTKGSVTLRESFSRLLVCYYRLIPQVALEEKFDVSKALAKVLVDYEGQSNNKLQFLELRNLLEIARRSQDVHWWHKSGELKKQKTSEKINIDLRIDNTPLSLFTTLLRIYSRERPQELDETLGALLREVSEQHCLFAVYDESSIKVLCRSLQEPAASFDIYKYLDDCLLQLVKKSVIYYEQFLSRKVECGWAPEKFKNKHVDLLLVAVADQWPFLVKASPSAKVSEITAWVASYFDLSMQAGRDRDCLILIRDRIIQDTPGHSALEQVLQANDSVFAIERPVRSIDLHGKTGPDAMKPPNGSEGSGEEALSHLQPPIEGEAHKVLTSWVHEHIPNIILDGTAGELTLCLCSKHEDIRRQALQALRKMRNSLKVRWCLSDGTKAIVDITQESDWVEAPQVYVLAGEIVETTERLLPDEPLPYFAGAFAVHCFIVRSDPSHPMYIKVNKYLLKRPWWDLNKLISYWIDKILLQPPTEDDGLHTELEWLLNILFDGLRSPDVSHAFRIM